MKNNKFLFSVLCAGVIFLALSAIFKAESLAVGYYLTAQISTAMGIGASASIPSNPFNSLVQQFQEREQMLSEKEKELQQKDAALQEQANGRQNSQNWLLIVLLILVSLNFYLDYRSRNRRETYDTRN